MRVLIGAACFVFLLMSAAPAAAQTGGAAPPLCGALMDDTRACDACCEVTPADVDLARADLDAKTARYERLRRAVGEDPLTDSELLAAPLIAQLLRDEDGLRRRLEELSVYLDPDNRSMRELLAQIDELERVVRAELRQRLAALQVEIEIARERLARMEALLAAERG